MLPHPHHVTAIIQRFNGLVQFANLLLIPGDWHVEVIEGERPERGIELDAVDTHGRNSTSNQQILTINSLTKCQQYSFEQLGCMEKLGYLV